MRAWLKQAAVDEKRDPAIAGTTPSVPAPSEAIQAERNPDLWNDPLFPFIKTYGVSLAVMAITGGATESEVPALTPEPSPASGVTFIGQQSGPSIVVPRGAAGPIPAWNGKGVQYTGGSGGPGLSPKVSGLRIMEPTPPKGPSPGYPSGSGSYFNATDKPSIRSLGERLLLRTPCGTFP